MIETNNSLSDFIASPNQDGATHVKKYSDFDVNELRKDRPKNHNRMIISPQIAIDLIRNKSELLLDNVRQHFDISLKIEAKLYESFPTNQILLAGF